MCEDIGDIDVLVTSHDPPAVMEAFLSLPPVTEVVGTGPTKSSVVTDLGVQVDLRVLEPDDFGAAWQYFTGSKQHNIHLREIAVRRGLKISEYGVFQAKNDRRLGGRTEEEIYQALDMPCPAPEIREDRGEVELMLKGELPALIEQSDLRGDLQMHTRASDGRGTIEDMVEAARALGYQYIGITDHSKSRAIAKGLYEDDLLKQVKTIRTLNEGLDDITVLAGVECDIKRNGELDYDDDILAQLDYVIVAIHSGFKLAEQEMTTRIVTALANPYVDMFGHPTGRIIGERDPYAVDLEQVMQAALDHGVALEINAFPDRLDLNDVHARRAKELGIPIVINTDAHAPDHLVLIRYGVATARRAWIAPEDVLNTRPLPELLGSLRRRRQPAPAASRRRRARSK
jgi:DNA polymerase (family 10)